ncbi:MAG: tRNA (adenosine(37)-N6)-dimethylallyltransferase MiaA [Lentimicrobium sp.]|jgi:tRNA dimethylallyltransferase|nr:tRNA (adenosine(37)-N6)-dimethylallyltransferase MiaA [Lentimicrobium sp.]
MDFRKGSEKSNLLVVITGPTAVGKTRLAAKLAQHYRTVVISADSRQFYRELRIGTAFPTPEELDLAPHHFVGHLSVNDDYNVSKYENEVLKFLDQAFKKHHLIILTGGSGLYVDVVCKGIDDLPEADPDIRRQIDKWLNEKGIEFLQEKLKAVDPKYFATVDKNNPKKLARAIEVFLLTGIPYSLLRKNQPKKRPFHILKIGLNMQREELFERISLRTDKMIEDGLVEEVRSLADYRNLNALNTVGYKEIFEYLDGKLSFEQAVINIKTNTRRYAKRQLTWLKRDKEIKWFEPDQLMLIINYIDECNSSSK